MCRRLRGRSMSDNDVHRPTREAPGSSTSARHIKCSTACSRPGPLRLLSNSRQASTFSGSSNPCLSNMKNRGVSHELDAVPTVEMSSPLESSVACIRIPRCDSGYPGITPRRRVATSSISIIGSKDLLVWRHAGEGQVSRRGSTDDLDEGREVLMERRARVDAARTWRVTGRQNGPLVPDLCFREY